jgi:hypothetical protein
MPILQMPVDVELVGIGARASSGKKTESKSQISTNEVNQAEAIDQKQQRHNCFER